MIDGASDPGDRAQSPRVLIVDHVASNLAIVARRVADSGYRIATAQGAEQALAQVHRMSPDLVLSELFLPGMDGVELARAIRGDATHRDLPLIFIAGKSRSDAAVRALAAGADDVIRKPFHFELLMAKIARQIDRARAVRSLHDTNAVLDARVVRRAIELGEMRDRWLASEAERLRLEELVRRSAV